MPPGETPLAAAPPPGTKKPTPMTGAGTLAGLAIPAGYCGCGSDRRLLSSCMSTATLASALACSRPWCAQKSSSPELASSTRTYAWAPQRSQTSSAVSGLVGASAPVNVAYLRVRPPAPKIRLAPVSCPYCSAQHIPRLKRSPLRVVYATSENHWRSVATTVATSHKVPASHRYSGAVPVAHRHRVSLPGHVPRLPSVDASVMVSLGFAAGPPRGMRGQPSRNATIFG